MTIGGHAYDATLAGGARHIHVYEPGGLTVTGISPDLPFATIDASIGFAYDVYTGDQIEWSGSTKNIPVEVSPVNVPYLPLYTGPVDSAGNPIDQGVDADPPLGTGVGFGIPLMVGATILSSVWGSIPVGWRSTVLSGLAGAGAMRGIQFSKPALLAALRSKGGMGIAIAALLGPILADTFLVDIDIPFVPSIPLPGLGDNGAAPMIGGDPVDFAIAQHGPVVKSWVANGTPFYLFMDGWQAAQKRNGTWKFWKPKKPIVYVPGGPMSKRNARRLASIYNMEKKRAKKEFNLVDSRQGQGARVSKPTVIVETGPGSVNTR